MGAKVATNKKNRFLEMMSYCLVNYLDYRSKSHRKVLFTELESAPPLTEDKTNLSNRLKVKMHFRYYLT